jgi:pimeloyl-ACP methyl ester carboxylesterase
VVIVAVLAGAAVLAGVAAAGVAGADAAPRLNWRPCVGAPAAQCATLRVPMDWSRPEGPRIVLALTRLPATDQKRRIGSVLFNCGGPGCPSAQLMKASPNLFTARLRQRFDIVGFDPRATGESTPVRCGLPALDPSSPRFPKDEAGYRRLVAFNRALARSCQKMTGAYLMNVGDPAVVRDMEAIRVALRDGKLNWLGLSYGTLLGAEYAERYPTHIRTLVLDGALDPALSEPGMLADEATAAENEFGRWAAWCNGSSQCPLHGRNVTRVWDQLIAAANRSPIPASNVHRGVTGEEIQNAVDASLLLFKRPTAFGPFSWLDIGPAIVKALHGDASAFAAPSPGPPVDPAYGVRAIECLDFPAQVHNFAEFKDRTTYARLLAPHMGGATETGRIISACVGWPRPRTDPRHFLRIQGAPPSLIVNSTYDPSTSYVWALSMQAQIPRSVLLTRHGDGHTSYLSSACAQRAIDRYFIDRVLPRPGTVCHD